ncbi:PepSY domain-containing protein [Bacillaceae bacterium IKA-2]|nr:PepSY domain-containing protein [Bacillaceae bacterium IKA-2]
MGLKRFLFGAGIGFLVGAFFKEKLTKELISPEKALRIVKQKLKEQGAVEGSWIHMIPENYQKNLLKYKVYHGGISCTIGSEFNQFDFIVDGHSGAILDLYSQD